MATAPILDDDDTGEQPAAHPLSALAQIAQSEGDISDMLDDQKLTRIGVDIVVDYERDLGDQIEWRTAAEKGLKRAAQEREELTNAPSYRASNVDYPILAVAALQFNARSYPAICKPGNMVKCKVVGSDKGRPQTNAQGQPLVSLNGRTVTVQQAQQLGAQAAAQAPAPAPASPGQPAPPPPQLPTPQPLWQIAPGAKQKRADRVSDYMNIYLQYRMDAWEEDTDQMLFEIPIVGCGFRKLPWADGKQGASYVSALDLVVPIKAKTLKAAPRTTERLNDMFPFEIKRKMKTGEYREVVLPSTGDDEQEPRLLLEAHRWMDLDEDGVDEPYIVTVDEQTRQVLRIVANFGPDDIQIDEQEHVVAIDKAEYYIKYPFLPHPKGIFYGMGFAHLVDQIGDVINTAINQMMDSGRAAIAGGGWVAAGLRLQGNNRSETIRWSPGEYKTVAVNGGDLRNGIVERTFPNQSPVMFQILEMFLAAAKDLTSVKDILTGDVPNTAPVGTTLAIVQQAQTVFTAIYKRIYRAAGNEFCLIYDNLAKHGDQGTAADYMNVLDDLDANFTKDFSERDMDISPVADPANVTPMQQVAKAQFLMGFRGNGLDDLEINKRALEAGGIEDIDQLLPKGPPALDPLTMAKIKQALTGSDLNEAKAQQASATATKTAVDVGHQLGESAGYGGGVSGVAGGSSNPMGAPGAGGNGAGPGGDLGAGIVDPAGA